METEFAAHYHKSEQAAAETYGRYQVLSAQDMADTVAWVLGAPDHMQVHDVLIRPRDQTS